MKNLNFHGVIELLIVLEYNSKREGMEYAALIHMWRQGTSDVAPQSSSHIMVDGSSICKHQGDLVKSYNLHQQPQERKMDSSIISEQTPSANKAAVISSRVWLLGTYCSGILFSTIRGIKLLQTQIAGQLKSM